MKMQRILVCLALSSFTVSLQADNDQNLDWLIGCWETPDGKSVEAWAGVGDGSLVGFSVDLADDELRFLEILSLNRNEGGDGLTRLRPGAHPRLSSLKPTSLKAASGLATHPMTSHRKLHTSEKPPG